jgi:glucokinase
MTRMMNKIVFGIDIGGTTVKCGYFHENGDFAGKAEITTRTEEGGSLILSDVADFIKKTVDEHGLTLADVAGIGIGVPGAVTDDGTVNKCVNLGWGVLNVADEMAKRIDVKREKIAVGNDANVAALGEYWKGSGRGCSSILMVTVGTGVGGGLIIDGKPVNGFNGAACEIGHLPMEDDLDFACTCGKSGCLEQLASATGIARMGGKPNAKEVFDAAVAGDRSMEVVVEKVSMYLGKALAMAACVSDPQCFIIGGGVCNAGEYFIEKIRHYYRQYAFHASRDTKIVRAELGNDAGMYGAAKLVIKGK